MTLALDLFLIVLLVLAIGYGFVLNRRIVALRHDQENLGKLAASFNTATARAESGVAQLRSATQESAAILQQTIAKADGIRGDLDYLLERGERTADRLEGAVRAGERGAFETGNGPRLNESEASESGGNNDEERQLLKALKAVR